jgi:hypothetical protein
LRIIDPDLLARCRAPGRCEWCGIFQTVREPHHLICRSAGRRLDIPINLIALGSGLHPCHTAIHAGNIDKAAVLAVVAARERTTPEDIQAVVWSILRVPKEGRPAQLEAEAATLTVAQQELFWSQLVTVAKALPPSDPDPRYEEPPW